MINRTVEILKKNPDYTNRLITAENNEKFEQILSDIANNDREFEDAFLQDAHEQMVEFLIRECEEHMVKLDMEWLRQAIEVINCEEHMMLTKDEGKVKVYNVDDDIIRIDIRKEKEK